MGATSCSISSGLNTVPVPWASRRTGHGSDTSTARIQTKSCLHTLCMAFLLTILTDNV